MIRSRKRRPTLAALVLGLVAGTVPALSGPALASHVDSVTVAPPVAAVPQDTCEPIVVTTSGGTNPQDALVDVEVRSTEILLNEAAADVTFCLPGGPEIINPVDIDPTTGDLGVGPVETDGTIGGEGRTAAGPDPAVTDGIFTFGIRTPSENAEFDLLAFVEEGAGNDDPDGDEPRDGNGGGRGVNDPIQGAAGDVATLDCSPEDDFAPGGSAHSFVCVAKDDAGARVEGALVAFDVTRGPNRQEIDTTSCDVTDADGVANCSYSDFTGPGSPPGTDRIVGFIDLNPTVDGPEVGAPRDRIRMKFLGAGATTKEVASRVSIKERFMGKVRSRVAKCKRGRKVLIKKVKPGKNPTVARDRTNRRGIYKVSKRHAKGRFYAVAKSKRFIKKGNIFDCRKDRSRTVRRGRR